MKSVHGELKVIPVRIDSSLLPPVLIQTLYLDLYSNGIEIVLKQMVDVIQGRNTFRPEYSGFSNLKAIISVIETGYNVDITAEYYMEPRSFYIILLKNKQDEANVGIRGSGLMQSGHTPNISLNNGLSGNGWFVGVSQATIPKFPFEIFIKKKSDTPIEIVAVLHEDSKDIWKPIPIILKLS